MYKPGDLVRHKNKPEWGLGRITGETGEGKVLVKFAARSGGDVLLTADGAAKFLVSDTGVVATVTAQLNAPPGPRPRHYAPVPTRKVPCVSCAMNIHDIRTSADGLWRSCPSCSARSGRHHVFQPFPAAFDIVDEVVPDGETSEDPKYGWCNACRAGGRVMTFKTCFQVR